MDVRLPERICHAVGVGPMGHDETMNAGLVAGVVARLACCNSSAIRDPRTQGLAPIANIGARHWMVVRGTIPGHDDDGR